ncbi:MAG TPA: gluconate 2-dehydrogenase subunit 3 family protein [Candidatus Binatia bacterium]|nr:gluconate 2-dehydrogenase subunit 3 family protein [Candidatus Binatia bacterium]
MTEDGFTPEEAALVDGLLDVVVPASGDGRLPAAGTLGLAAAIAERIARTPMLRPVVEYGLGALADRATQRNPGGWAALTADDRSALVREFAASDDFFMPAFLFLAYASYYRHPRVVTTLGREPRPPHPEGYAMDEDDWSEASALLAPVRRRRKLYRG